MTFNPWQKRAAREPPECELPNWEPSNVTVELMLDYLEDMANNWHGAPMLDEWTNTLILHEITEEAMFLLAREGIPDA